MALHPCHNDGEDGLVVLCDLEGLLRYSAYTTYGISIEDNENNIEYDHSRWKQW